MLFEQENVCRIIYTLHIYIYLMLSSASQTQMRVDVYFHITRCIDNNQTNHITDNTQFYYCYLYLKYYFAHFA